MRYLTKACTVKFNSLNVGDIHGTITLPAGLECSPIMRRTGALKCSPMAQESCNAFFLDEFPTNIFPERSMILHDAVHYGVVLTADQVEVLP